MAKEYKLHLKEIEESLRLVQKNWNKINESLMMRRETLDDTILANMMEGYSYVNMLLRKDIDPLDRSELNHYLELNHIVLCGTEKKKRKDFRKHIEHTTDRFYKAEEFSISHMRKWLGKHKKNSAWVRAAGLYIMGVSQPQLFFEGNHRTLAKQTNKDVYGKLYKLPKIKRNFAEFLKANANNELMKTRKK